MGWGEGIRAALFANVLRAVGRRNYAETNPRRLEEGEKNADPGKESPSPARPVVLVPLFFFAVPAPPTRPPFGDAKSRYSLLPLSDSSFEMWCDDACVCVGGLLVANRSPVIVPDS